MLTQMIATGSDNGEIKIWDISKLLQVDSRELSEPEHCFTHHRGPITSIEWSPFDSSELMVSSDDNSVTLWDMSLFKDPGDESEFPAQLLFEHLGQKQVKELHWHRQIEGVVASIAFEGICVWKPSIEIIDEGNNNGQ